MADANRLTVSNLVLHHAVTPLWDDKSKAWLADWFSNNGFARAYGSNSANWSGLINPYTGKRSYSQAHYAGQRVTSRTPDATAAEKKAGYRLVPLVKDVWGQITWHAGNWAINRASIGIENLGDYRNYTLRDGDCKVIANFWRAQDKKLNGSTKVWGHKQVSQTGTVCPARIMEKIGTVVKYIDNPPKEKVMVTSKSIQVYMRFYRGRTASAAEQKKWVGKITDDQLQAILVKKGNVHYDKIVKEVGTGKYPIQNHLPSRMRDAFKAPVAPLPADMVEVTEKLYRKKV